MSLTVDGFWKAGFWSETFWADGFWYEGAPAVVESSQPSGGVFTKPLKRRYQSDEEVRQRRIELGILDEASKPAPAKPNLSIVRDDRREARQREHIEILERQIAATELEAARLDALAIMAALESEFQLNAQRKRNANAVLALLGML